MKLDCSSLNSAILTASGGVPKILEAKIEMRLLRPLNVILNAIQLTMTQRSKIDGRDSVCRVTLRFVDHSKHYFNISQVI